MLDLRIRKGSRLQIEKKSLELNPKGGSSARYICRILMKVQLLHHSPTTPDLVPNGLFAEPRLRAFMIKNVMIS